MEGRKNMEKLYAILTLVLSGLLVGSILGTSEVSAAGFQVTFTTNPTVVAPGTNGFIQVNLRSLGSVVNNIEITATSLDAKTVIPQGDWDVEVGSLDSGESSSVLFEFKVPSTASPGLYQVLFDITGGNIVSQTAVIQVQDATVLDLTAMSPTEISIGQATTVNFTLTNTGDDPIHNVLFIWDDSNNLILPVGSDNRITIPLIGANNSTDVPVVMMASSGISPGVYPLNIVIQYYDQTGTRQLVNSTVGMQISGKTTFDIVLQTSSGTTTTFAVVNTGANTASSVVVSIPRQVGHTTTGTSSTSVGNLDAGDYTLASFSITSTSTNTTRNGTFQFPSYNRSGTNTPPSGRNFTGGQSTFLNQSLFGGSTSRLLVQIAYTDVFGVRQTVQKYVNLSSSTNGFSSRSTTGASSFNGGFSTQTQSSSSNSLSNTILYIGIGVAGIIIIVAVIQLGRRRKLSNLIRSNKERKE
jgi:hypothetical protein